MDKKQIIHLVAALREKGITFEKGLSDKQVKYIEAIGSFQFPPDLRTFLQYAVPISHTRVLSSDADTSIDQRFPNWHQDPEVILQKHHDNLIAAFRFDVEHNDFWMEKWGIRPEKPEDAFPIVVTALESAPQLIPVYAHRYLPAFPVLTGNPVLSMWQASDTIYYGYNLEVYFHNEFLRPRDQQIYGQPSDYRQIPFWSDMVS